MRKLTKIRNESNWPLTLVQIHRTNRFYKFKVPQTVCTMWDLRFSQMNCWWFKSNQMLYWDYLWPDVAYHPRVLETSVHSCICCDKKWRPTTNYVVHHQSTNGVRFVILCAWNKENLILFVFGYTANLYPVFPYMLPVHNYCSILLVPKNQAPTLHVYIGCIVPQSVDFTHP
jgi:hypothetical protein